MIRPAGAVDTWYQQLVGLASCVSEEPILSPLQGCVFSLSTPGVETPGLVLQSLLRDKNPQLSTKSKPQQFAVDANLHRPSHLQPPTATTASISIFAP
jgi:hypothetical protein